MGFQPRESEMLCGTAPETDKAKLSTHFLAPKAEVRRWRVLDYLDAFCLGVNRFAPAKIWLYISVLFINDGYSSIEAASPPTDELPSY